LTADERVGELLDEVAASEEALLRVDATRKVRTDVYAPDRRALAIGLGTDLGALLGAWLTAWERHGDPDAEQKIRGALAGIGALPQGPVTGGALWDLDAAASAPPATGSRSRTSRPCSGWRRSSPNFWTWSRTRASPTPGTSTAATTSPRPRSRRPASV